MSEIWRLALPLRWRLLGAGLLGAGTEAAGLALMATATWLLVTAAGQPPLHALTVAIVTVRALAISRGGLRYLERLASHDAVLRMITEVRARIFAALVDQEPSSGDSLSPSPARPTTSTLRRGDVLTRMVSDVDAIQDLVVRVALPIAAAGLVSIAAVGTAGLLDPLVGVVLAVGLLLTGAVLPFLAARLAGHGGARLAPLRANYATDTIDLVHGAADLAAFGARDRFEQIGADHARELAGVEQALARRAFVVDALASIITGVTAVAVLLTANARGVPGVWAAVLAVGTLATGEIALSLLAAARKGAEIRGSLDRVAELLRAPANIGVERVQLPQPTTNTGSTSRENSAGVASARSPQLHAAEPVTLRLDQVRVSFRLDAPAVLDGVDLELPPGHRLAVVGPSGAGKTTLLGLLTGTVRPDSGTATANGTPISDHDPQQWPSVVSGLMADAHLFHATVRDNLLLGRPDASDSDLVVAATVAGLGDWIADQQTPSHSFLDIVVGEDGAQLSGGQRQRLALARAVLAGPPVLLLDEPTEGLDPAHADQVLTDVLAHVDGRTVVLVTHRLVGLAQFDEVVVLDRGRILERGSYDELVAADGWVRAHAA